MNFEKMLSRELTLPQNYLSHKKPLSNMNKERENYLSRCKHLVIPNYPIVIVHLHNFHQLPVFDHFKDDKEPNNLNISLGCW
jgi:hypothetical protein